MNSGEYLNIREAAMYLGVSDAKIRRLVSNGLLMVSFDPLDDRKRLVKKNDLDALKTPRPVIATSSKHEGKGTETLTRKKKNTINKNRRSSSNES